MRQHGLGPKWSTLIAATAVTATATSAAFSLKGIGDTYHIINKVTYTSGTTATLDMVLQTSVDGGTTYINLPIRSTQITTASGQIHWVFKMGLGGNEAALESPAADTGGTLAKNCIFDPNFMKIKYTTSGTNPTYSVTTYGAQTPAGSNSI